MTIDSRWLPFAASALLATATSACKPTPTRPAETPVLEVHRQGMLIAGTRVDEPHDAGWLWRSSPHELAVKRALEQNPGKAPLIVAAPEVPFDRLFRAVMLVTNEIGGHHDGLRARATDDPSEKAPPVRVRCIGSDRAIEVHAPTQFTGALAEPLPPQLLIIVLLAEDGIHVSATEFVRGPPTERPIDGGDIAAKDPTTRIPRTSGALDFAVLRGKLRDLPKAREAIVAADMTSVTAGDVCTTLETVVQFFPNVTLSTY